MMINLQDKLKKKKRERNVPPNCRSLNLLCWAHHKDGQHFSTSSKLFAGAVVISDGGVVLSSYLYTHLPNHKLLLAVSHNVTHSCSSIR